MATRNFVPRADAEGGLGTALKNWATAYIVKITADQVIMSDGAGNYMQLPKLTSGERDALTPVNGMVIYNSTATSAQAYQNGGWGTMGGVVASGITTSLINTSAVTTAKIAASAITTTLINATAVTAAKIAPNAVTTTKIAASAVTTAKINTSAVTTAKIAASAITTTLINATAVTATKIAPDAITTTKIATSAVDLSSQVVGELPASRLTFLKIGSPTYDNAQDWINIVQSASVIDGFALSKDRLSYQLDVTSGSGLIKITDSPIGVTKPFDIGTTENVTLTDNSMNYIYIDYNGGTPVVVATATRANIEINRHCVIGRCYKDGTGGSAVLTILSAAVHASNLARTEHERLVDVYGFQHASGAAVSETGTLNFAVTAGRWYLGHNLVTTDAADTNAADTFIYTHYGAASWIEDNAAATVFDYTHYNQGADALGTLTVNRYGVHWVYILQDSELYVIYGAGDYTLTDADDAQPPTSIPSIVDGMGELLAKVIIKQDGTLISIESVFELALSLSGTIVHNEASGLQGGTANEYYHLTSAQAAMLTSSGITTTLINTSAVTTGKIAGSAITTTLINATAVTAAKIAPNAVTTTKIAASAVTTAKINTSAVTTGKIAGSAITTTLINTSAVTTAKIAGSAITTTLINATAVTAAKIAPNAVTTTKIAASAVTTAKINTSAVTTGKIAGSAITTTLINTSAVTTAKIAGSAITTTLINATAVTAAKIAPNAVTTTKIAASAVTTAKINTSAVTTGKIAASAITTTLINANAITITKIADGTDGELITWDADGYAAVVAVGTAGHVLTSSGVGRQPTFKASGGVASSGITTTLINTSAVTTAKIAGSAITTTLINATAVTAAKIAPNAVTTTKIAASAVTTAKINTSAVTTGKIAASAITTTLINANAVTTAKIAGSAITTTLINNGAVTATKIASGVLTRCIYLPVEGAYLPATNPAALVEEEGATTYAGWSHGDFDDTTSEHMVWRVRVPGYDGGNITVRAGATPATTPVGAVTLQFNILTIGVASSEAFKTAVTVDTTVNISFAMDTTELNSDLVIATATIDPANVADGDWLVFELARDVATDDLSGDGQLLWVELEYTRS